MNKQTKRVLLANAFFLNNDPKQLVEKFKPYPPLAALYAAGSLRAQEIEVSLFDATLSDGLPDFIGAVEKFDPDLLLICEDSFNFLSKMCLSHVRETTIDMIALAKARDIPIAINSSDAADSPKPYLDAGAEFVILGEVETTLVELVNWLNEEQQEAELPAGLIYNHNGQWGRSVRRNTNRAIDNLPQPYWDLVDIEKYRKAWHQYHGYYGVNIVTTRGCPYRCNWCAKPIWGQQYVCHSPAYIVEQIKLLQQFAQPQHIWFADDIFGLKRGWIEEFAQLMSEAKLKTPFMIQTRADLMTTSTVNALKSAGCQEVWLGVESGSQLILDSMDKDLTLKQVSEARTLLRDCDISCGFFIQLGYLNEDIEQIKQTREMIVDMLPDEIGVSVSYPLPGTGFYDKVKARMSNKTHWQDSNDLDAVFNATFTSDFYRRIRNHLHQELTSLLRNPDCQNTQKHWQNQWQDLMSSAESYRNRLSTTFAEA
ncbi:Mg-protoporphyrin IX monomethyl ester oxidative cyclase [Alteromonas sp. KUL42]|uniref:B12-binding domain-containing radical SAM protein n=1 Tax=Alteromonas sp. KUL42 TaxID=2480797 RepID=UPI0010360D13|nr:radical SAM protein [Alteromonas sp. KUL42]TAP33480.1 B12-binding domain-containing radical SAM protein [Alteromonas sp. KUL42]GEA08345.1 Mg-protoporphyrin IX monomethyl ester oxidative cyclase [Alteromonas sp. KUL42]